jgi:hypothetical protein
LAVVGKVIDDDKSTDTDRLKFNGVFAYYSNGDLKMLKNRSFIIGLLGSIGLLVVWLGVLTFTESFSHALQQFNDFGPWIIILSGGFGLQLGLYSFIKSCLKKKKGGATAEVAATGGISTGAMIACCAHHLVEILPIIGLGAAAVFLVNYQLPFIGLGIFSNLVGIAMMLLIMQRNGIYPVRRMFMILFNFNMRKIRNVTVVIAVFVVAFLFLLASFEKTAEAEAVAESFHNLTAKINDENLVTFEVTPLDFSFNEPIRIEVAINTHQGDLDFEMTEITTLEDENGTLLKPMSWEGSPPGGHHRSGILTFPGIHQKTSQIKLTIRDVYGVPKRIFEWQLK